VPLYLGLDFGGTKLAAGLADENGRLVVSGRRPTIPETGADGALEGMRELVDGFGDDARCIEAVGISFGGPVDRTRTRTLLSHHGPGWVDVPICERAQRMFGRSAVMDNDANAAALGEWRFGAAKGTRNALYLTVSTGIGGGIIVEDRLYRGSHGLSGEIGHVVVRPDGPPCACGKRGCLEAVSSGPAIARAYVEIAASEGAAEVTAADVFRGAASGDDLAARVLAEAIHCLGVGIADAINLLDPDVVVVGGGVSRAGAALFVPLQSEVRSACLYWPDVDVPVIPAALGDEVGILGAVALILEDK
jgi:glucokinase